MARRLVVVVAIVGALLLFVGSLLANPLLRHFGLRPNHEPGPQVLQYTVRPHKGHQQMVGRTGHLPPAQPNVSVGAGTQGVGAWDRSQGADPSQTATTTTRNASGPVGWALNGIKTWWSDRLSDAAQIWSRASHDAEDAFAHIGGSSAAAGGGGSPRHTNAGTSSGGVTSHTAAGGGGLGPSFGGTGSSGATTGGAPGGGGPSPTIPSAGAAQGAVVGSNSGGGTSGAVPPLPPGGDPSPVPLSRANFVMIPDMAGQDAPYAWNDNVILSRATGGFIVHWTDPQGDDLMGRAGKLVQEGMPAAMLYTFPHMSSDFTPWGPQLTEDMYLHNGGDGPANRVRHSPDELQTVMDVGNPNYANTIATFLAGLVNDNGLSGLYLDGIHGNLSIKYIWDWIVPPTQDQINAWLSRSRVLYAALKRALGPKLLITSTSDPGAWPDLVAADDAIIDLVDGTFMEGWLTGSWGTLNNYGYAVYKNALARAKVNNKILWVANSDENNPGLLMNLYGIYLLDAGPNLWFQVTTMDPGTLDAVSRDPGQALGDAAQQSDGTWVRDFENVTVRANPSDDSLGGMDPWSSNLMWKSGSVSRPRGRAGLDRRSVLARVH